MRVLQINAVYGRGSTGIIMREIQSCCEKNGIDGYVAYSLSSIPAREIQKGYKIGNCLTEKWHAVMSRIAGKQAYYNRLTTWLFLKWVDKIKPDVVHLHNLHSNYIHLNMLLRYLAKHDIATVITMHDCWYFTGGCFHYANIDCDKWQQKCGSCPKRKQDTPAYLFDASKQILKDRKRYLTAIHNLYVVGCSEWVANEAKKSVLSGCDIRFIYNGFDLDVFKPSPTEKARHLGIEGKHILLGPANKWLSAVNKDTLDYFIKMMPDDYVLILFGVTDQSRVFADNVMLYGYTSSREELAQLYSMADVFVNCSREDTLSSLNIEAQACGTPVVTYEATGSQETVNGKCGFAVKTGDFEALWSSASDVVAKGKKLYSPECVNWASEEFDKNNNFNKYIHLYREAAVK